MEVPEICCEGAIRQSAAIFRSNIRPHISINVPDVKTARHFYISLFGREPVKDFNDYVKWDLEYPPLNFTLNQHPIELISKESFGIEMEFIEQITALLDRLGKTKLTDSSSENFIVYDPDGNSWKFSVRDPKIFPTKKDDLPDATLWEFAWESSYPDPDANIVIKLNVDNLEESILFYSYFLNMEPIQRNEKQAVFWDDDPAIKLELFKNSSPTPCSGHYGLQMKSTALVEAVYNRLVNN